jgi:ABC-type siderophore export system fused ATPase/permease subunit
LIIIKWLGTILCLIGIALTSFNIYPLNILFGLVGSVFWTLAGFMQRDIPLLLVEFVAVVLYLGGVVSYVTIQLGKWA